MASGAEIDDWAFEEVRPIQTPKLSDQILDKCVESMFDDEVKKFLPAGCIDELVSLEAIIKEVRKKDHLQPGDLDLPEGSAKKKLVDFVRGKANKVFAITVISGIEGGDLGKAMHQFMEIGFTNESLPLKEEHLKDIAFFRNMAYPWSKTRIFKFCREQWIFLAPVFSQQNFMVNLRPEHILPFIKKSEVVKEGAFGQVYMVDIHPAHQEDPILNVRQFLPFTITHSNVGH
jgi:hypothetical protein